MSFKLKMKVLLFLVSSVVSFSAQNENLQADIKNNDVINHENYLISAVKKKNKSRQESSENDGNNETEENTTELLKYSQRNDGVIDLNSLVHNEDSEFRVLNGTNVKIMLRTKNNDVYSAEVVYSGGKKIMVVMRFLWLKFQAMCQVIILY